MSKHLYNYGEAADYLGVQPSTVKKLCDRHEIGYIVKSRLRGYGRYIRRQLFIPKARVRRRGKALRFSAEADSQTIIDGERKTVLSA